MTDLAAPRGRLRVRGEGDTIVLAVEGPFDGESGGLLVAAVASTRDAGPGEAEPVRVEIDLVGVTSYTEAGAEALARCRRLAEALPCHLSYRADSPIGRSLLIETLRAPH